jgi:hypothetical protein
MNTLTSGSKDKISIYEVEDDTVSISENLKKFTLIVYEDKHFAIYIKGNKLKKTESANVNENDESSISELVKSKSPLNNLQGGSQVNATTKSLIKLNEMKLNTISKHEALNFALKANKDIKTLYVVSLSNYLKQIEYSILKINADNQIIN